MTQEKTRLKKRWEDERNISTGSQQSSSVSLSLLLWAVFLSISNLFKAWKRELTLERKESPLVNRHLLEWVSNSLCQEDKRRVHWWRRNLDSKGLSLGQRLFFLNLTTSRRTELPRISLCGGEGNKKPMTDSQRKDASSCGYLMVKTSLVNSEDKPREKMEEDKI